MTDRLDLSLPYRTQIEALLREHVPEAEVWAYGSRVNGSNHEAGDLDLVLRGPNLERLGTDYLGLLEAIEESNIPILIQVHDWATLPESLHREIERDYVVVQRGAVGSTVSGEWRQANLEQLGTIITGKTPSSRNPEYFGGDVPFVTPKDFTGRRRIDFTERHLTEKGANAVKGARIPSGAVMVSCIGSDMGKAAISIEPCVTNQQINSLIVDSDNDPLFIYYNLSKRKDEIRGSAGGSAQPILNKAGFGQLSIMLPPLGEQRAIAHVLGTLDDKIELNRRMNETLEQMARALFKSWFVDFDPVRAKMDGRWRPGQSLPGLPAHLYDLFPTRLVPSELGEIPAGWEVTQLGEAIAIHDSRRIPLNARQRAIRRGPYPYYGAAGIMDYVDNFLFEGVHVLTGEDGSVLDADGHPVIQYVWGQFWVNNHAHVLSGTNGISDEHLYLLLRQVSITAFVTGAVQPKLSQKNLKVIPIVFPDGVVCNAFSGVIAPLFEEVRDNADETKQLAILRDTLLPKMMSGESQMSVVLH